MLRSAAARSESRPPAGQCGAGGARGCQADRRAGCAARSAACAAAGTAAGWTPRTVPGNSSAPHLSSSPLLPGPSTGETRRRAPAHKAPLRPALAVQPPCAAAAPAADGIPGAQRTTGTRRWRRGPRWRRPAPAARSAAAPPRPALQQVPGAVPWPGLRVSREGQGGEWSRRASQRSAVQLLLPVAYAHLEAGPRPTPPSSHLTHLTARRARLGRSVAAAAAPPALPPHPAGPRSATAPASLQPLWQS